MLFGAGASLLALSALSPLVGLVNALVISKPRATVCNGNAALCSRNYANVTYIGAHDSYSIDTNPLDLASNQEIDITAQLDMGVRMLQSQAHLSGSTLELCHTSCLLYDGGSLESYLSTVKSWLDTNPNEVVTLLITNGDAISIPDFWVPAFTNADIIKYTFVPPASASGKTGWPTLGDMIDAGTRLVVFMDANSNTTAAPYILPEFNFVWETPFDVTDNTFPCKVDRGTSSSMLLINHFLDTDVLGTGIDIPARSQAGTTNSQTSILADANGCTSLNGGLAPTFVLLDFVDQGQAIATGNFLNGLS
ncbi:PLC-like phosphodiesterase [Clavulina sp. PMI_390]|nr:PLC-like phosphodiesterase [Clavulina sp. PMI_390]